MVKPSSGQRGDRSSCYQQALDDFGITQLLLRISNYADGDFNAARMCLKEQELESIVTLLIEQLTANIKGSVLANYLYIIRDQETLQRPWAIARILPGAKTHTIACFFNRQDAEDHLRTLRRYVPNGVFEIVFQPPES